MIYGVDILHILAGFWPLYVWLLALLALQVWYAFGKH